MRYDQRATLGKIERMKGAGGNQGLKGSSKNQSLLCKGLNDQGVGISGAEQRRLYTVPHTRGHGGHLCGSDISTTLTAREHSIEGLPCGIGGLFDSGYGGSQ